MAKDTIDIGKEFSRYPAGRTAKDGDYSGQNFLKQKLLPALQEHQKVVVILDNALSYGSSFLEEAFGGLIRDQILKPEEIWKKIEIRTDDPFLRAEIDSYVRDEIERL